MDTKIYDLIRSYIAKENFTKQELSDLGVAIANLGGTQDNPELLKRFSSMRVRILEDKKIKKLNKTCVSLVNSTIITLTLDWIETVDSEITSLDIAIEIISDNLDLINSGDFVVAKETFLPVSVVDEFKNRLSERNKDYLWYKESFLILHILSGAYINIVGFNFYMEENLLVKFLKLSLIQNLITAYCCILNIGLVIWVYTDMLKHDKSFLFNLTYAKDVCIHNYQLRFTENYLKYSFVMISVSSLINYTLLRIFGVF